LIPSAAAAEIVNLATGEKRAVNKANAYLKTLAIRQLRRSNRGFARGWVWYGETAGLASTVPLKNADVFTLRP
jgi:hypothetical protein